jgi:hypothetical protein
LRTALRRGGGLRALLLLLRHVLLNRGVPLLLRAALRIHVTLRAVLLRRRSSAPLHRVWNLPLLLGALLRSLLLLDLRFAVLFRRRVV